MESINPYSDEEVRSETKYVAELRAALASIEARKAYLLSELARFDPTVKQAEDFIDGAYTG